MEVPAVSDLWWKNAVVYSLDVATFMDSDGDGIGDFQGLTQRLGYLGGLGVTCLWLLPCYPSPDRDDGYDVTDYYTVDPRLGTLGDFVEFLRTARERGIRVVMDLVVNHTSSDHPWFQQARTSRDSPYRDWYVWTDEPPPGSEDLKVIFPDVEDSVWEWDEKAGQYYLHRFYSHEPDLNVANPAVRDEINRIMGFWLELGVSGFRVDAAPYLIGGTGIEDEMPQDPHDILRSMQGFLSRRRGDAVMFGEVNLDPGEREQFAGDGDEMTGLFDFILCGEIFTALAREDAGPLVEALRLRRELPSTAQWLVFARNHDELNLSRLPEEHRRDVFEAFAPDDSLRLFGRGVRRRVPPMLDGDSRRVELVYSLVFTLPGAPVLLYGEEIGMAENLDVPGRRAVRTPMQWTAGPHGGFTPGDGAEPVRPPVEDGPYGYRRVNVADQRRQPDSLLSRVERFIRARKESPEFGWGEWAVVDTGDPRVLAHRCDWQTGMVLAVHNLSGEEVEVVLDIQDAQRFDEIEEMLGSAEYEPLDPSAPRCVLPPYGYRWLRGREAGSHLAL